jgi:hypothetical protein
MIPDGGRNPTFDEKFHIPLIEGLRELNVVVWNSNTLTHDDFIGSGRVYLHKVLANGYDDSSWPLQTRNMRYSCLTYLDCTGLMNFLKAGSLQIRWGSEAHYAC